MRLEPGWYVVMVCQSLVQSQIYLVKKSFLLYIDQYHLLCQSSEFLHHNNFFLLDLLSPTYYRLGMGSSDCAWFSSCHNLVHKCFRCSLSRKGLSASSRHRSRQQFTYLTMRILLQRKKLDSCTSCRRHWQKLVNHQCPVHLYYLFPTRP